MRRIYIPTLNGWRAVAVLLVIGAHSNTMLLNSGTGIGAFLVKIFSHAGIGVDIFFSISGFLICTLLLREKTSMGSIDLQSFYIRRAFRILPPIFAYLFCLVILTVEGITPSVKPIEIISSALFFRNYVTDSSWYAGHFWSLAIEEHFYLVVPLMLATLSWKASLRWAIGIVIACTLIRVAEFTWMTDVQKIEFRTEGRIDAIMYGTIGAFLFHNDRQFLERHLTGMTTLAIVIVALVGCYTLPYMPVRRSLIALAMPFPIIFTSLHAETLLAQFLKLAPMDWIGRLSYSLYIWQMMFLVPATRQMPTLQAFPVAFGCVLICAIASYYLIERPFIKLGHSIADRRRVQMELNQRGSTSQPTLDTPPTI